MLTCICVYILQTKYHLLYHLSDLSVNSGYLKRKMQKIKINKHKNDDYYKYSFNLPSLYNNNNNNNSNCVYRASNSSI